MSGLSPKRRAVIKAFTRGPDVPEAPLVPARIYEELWQGYLGLERELRRVRKANRS